MFNKKDKSSDSTERQLVHDNYLKREPNVNLVQNVLKNKSNYNENSNNETINISEYLLFSYNWLLTMDERHHSSLKRSTALARKSESPRAHLTIDSASKCGRPRAESPQLFLCLLLTSASTPS